MHFLSMEMIPIKIEIRGMWFPEKPSLRKSSIAGCRPLTLFAINCATPLQQSNDHFEITSQKRFYCHKCNEILILSLKNESFLNCICPNLGYFLQFGNPASEEKSGNRKVTILLLSFFYTHVERCNIPNKSNFWTEIMIKR